jgi:hypothetical protein
MSVCRKDDQWLQMFMRCLVNFTFSFREVVSPLAVFWNSGIITFSSIPLCTLLSPIPLHTLEPKHQILLCKEPMSLVHYATKQMKVLMKVKSEL